MLTTIRFILILFFAILLPTACGGGGGDNNNTPANQSPTANFFSTITANVDPLTVNLDASASSDSDGLITSYSWDFGDGSRDTGISTSHTYSATGNFDVTLTVTDDDNATHSISQTLNITTNVIAAISLSGPANGPSPHTLTFDGSGSTVLAAFNGQPSIISYEWTFGDGNTASGAIVSHTYDTDGQFTAVLTVTDSSGDSNSAEVIIKTVFNLSGVISAASGSVTDIDVNDPARQNRNNPFATFNTNNSSLEAQPLPNPAILNGFISAVGFTPPGSGNSNFANDGDLDDYYSAQLVEGQFISLRVSDFLATSPATNNVDLELYDGNLNLIAFSDSMTELESIAVTTQGNYFIRVRAISGVSKYVLNIGNTSLVTGLSAYGKSADFIAGEAIVKMKPASLFSTQFFDPASVMALSHNDTSRAALTRFVIPGVKTANIQAQTSSKNATALNTKNHSKLATLDYIKQLNTRADVEYAEPNYRVRANRIPDDDFYFLQAHYPQINLPQAWDITTGIPAIGSVVVAVIDSGVVLNHEDLVGQFVNANDDFDFVSNINSSADGNGIDANPDDPGDGVGNKPNSWHGTHVAGTIAATTNNNLGVAGVSWGAKIMPIRVLGRDGGTSYDVEQGVRFAAGLANDSGTTPSKRADVINISLGGEGFSLASQALYNQVRNAGVIVIASAGNESTSMPSYPASYNAVISVSAVDLVNNLAPYSNFGPLISVAAPGGDLSVDRNADGYGDGVLSTLIDNSNNRDPSYQFYQGTSMASPHVAGVAALMKAIYPALTPDEFDAGLQNGLLTSDIGDAGRDDKFGYGLIDALKAVQQAQLLAGGSATGSVLASPTLVDFGAVLTSRSLTLSQVGSSPPNVTSVTSTAAWLGIDNSAIAADGSGTYTFTAERTGLADAIYTENVVFALSNGNNLVIPVSMQVQNTISSAGDVGFLFVLLINADTFVSIAQRNVDVEEGVYNYSFTNVPPGEYFIVAGSDVDNDLIICGTGESCGRYPTNDQPLRIVANDDINKLDFLASIVSDITSNTTASSYEKEGFIRKSLPKSDRQDVNNQSVNKILSP